MVSGWWMEDCLEIPGAVGFFFCLFLLQLLSQVRGSPFFSQKSQKVTTRSVHQRMLQGAIQGPTPGELCRSTLFEMTAKLLH